MIGLKRSRTKSARSAVLLTAESGHAELFRTALRSSGFSVRLCATEADLAKHVAQLAPDLVLLDSFACSQPIAEQIASLRSLRPTEPPLIVLLASPGTNGDLDAALQAGVSDFVPRDHPELLDARLKVLEQRLDEQRHRRQAERHLDRLAKALETMQLGVTITDSDGRIVYTNPAEAEMHGFTVDELVGHRASDLAPSRLRSRKRPIALQDATMWRRETVNLRKDGETFPVRLLSNVLHDESGQPAGIVTTCEDITERKEAERALFESEERYALAARGSNDGLWDWDLDRDSLYVSERWQEMLGLKADQVQAEPTTWTDRVHPEDAGALKAEIDAVLAGRKPHLECEHRLRRADGTYLWVLARGCAVRSNGGQARRMAGSLTDISDRRLRDPLTRLPNRALVLDRLDQAFERARRSGDYEFAVFSLALDRLADVNQSFGPRVADRVVMEASERLRGVLRAVDTVASHDLALAHLGSGTFTVLVTDIGEPRDAARIASRLQECFEQPFEIGGHEIFTSASVGIAFATETYAGSADLLRDAETARSQARSGGGTYVVFDQQMHERAMAALQLENELRRAVEREEFEVLYQPIVSLRRGTLVGFEALVRWRHPNGSLMRPEQFVPLAERTGLIVPIDRLVIAQTCRQIRQWKAAKLAPRDLTVAVNVSGLQFSRADFTVEVDRLLRSIGLFGRALKLEITESVLMEQARYAQAMLSQLRALDIKVSIDDFGTGYSSLSYLHRFEIDTLKVDRSFVQRGVNDRGSEEILRAIVTLGRNLGKDVVAEGLETRSQVQLLRDLDCEFGQGFFFAGPLDAETATEFLQAAPHRSVFEL